MTPTKEEYLKRVKQIQEDELKSDRFSYACKAIEMNRIMNRDNDLMDELFSIIGSYGLEDHLINESSRVIIQNRMDRFYRLNKIMSNLSDSEIESNSYLLYIKKYMEYSIKDCNLILKDLIGKISLNETQITEKEIYEVEVDIPRNRTFELRIPEEVGISYYNPEEYKISYIDILPKNKKYIYEEYNKFIDTLNRLAHDIYLLQMTVITSVYPDDLFPYNFQIYNTEESKKFIVNFSMNNRNKFSRKSSEDFIKGFVSKINNGEFKRDVEPNIGENFNPTPEFIDTTINNFTRLLKSGIVDIIEDKPKQYKIERKK